MQNPRFLGEDFEVGLECLTVVYRPYRRTYDSDLAEAQLSIIEALIRKISLNVKVL
jgi:hypothetical protein